MNEDQDSTLPAAAGSRFKLAVAMLILSIVVPAAGIPVAASLGLPVAATGAVSGALLMGGELLGVAAVALMGKPGYIYLKTLLRGFLRQYGPAREVSRVRYNLGLAMFCIPLVFAWLAIYFADLIPGFATNPLPYAIGGDLLLLASLFVLGGSFWDKLRALFVHDAVARFPDAPAVGRG